MFNCCRPYTHVDHHEDVVGPSVDPPGSSYHPLFGTLKSNSDNSIEHQEEMVVSEHHGNDQEFDDENVENSSNRIDGHLSSEANGETTTDKDSVLQPLVVPKIHISQIPKDDGDQITVSTLRKKLLSREPHELYRAANFVRGISDKDARANPEIVNKEKAMVLFLFLQSVTLEFLGKENSIPTVIAFLIENAEGEKALATTKVIAAAQKLQFMAKAYYKPILEQLKSPHPKRTVAQVISDIHTTANVLFGTKPPTLIERIDPVLSDILEHWSWEKCKEWQKERREEYQQLMEKLLDEFDVCRQEGSSYKKVMAEIIQKIS